MAFAKVIGIFDDPVLVERAESALIWSGLATRATMRVDSEELVQELHPPRVLRPLERLKDLLPFHGDDDGRAGDANGDGAGAHRALFLVVTVPEDRVALVEEIMRREAAAERQRTGGRRRRNDA